MKLVLFDVDGTISDSQAQICAAMDYGFTELGLPVPPRAAILSIVGLSLPEAVARLVPDQPPAVQDRIDWPAFLARHDLLWGRIPKQWHEGAFLGNGLLGTMVWAQDGEALHFDVGRSDEAQALLPMATICEKKSSPSACQRCPS